MIDLSDLIQAEAVLPAVAAASKKQVLLAVAEQAAGLTGVDEKTIVDLLMQREKLGSTGIGGGIAIPHARLPGVTGITGVFAHLTQPVDFEALDEQPVDLVFLLLAPEVAGAEHLKALARIARAVRDPAVAARLRASFDGPALYSVLSERPDAA